MILICDQDQPIKTCSPNLPTSWNVNFIARGKQQFGGRRAGTETDTIKHDRGSLYRLVVVVEERRAEDGLPLLEDLGAAHPGVRAGLVVERRHLRRRPRGCPLGRLLRRDQAPQHVRRAPPAACGGSAAAKQRGGHGRTRTTGERSLNSPGRVVVGRGGDRAMRVGLAREGRPRRGRISGWPPP